MRARSEAEVLSVYAAIVRRLKQAMEPEVPKVLAAVFEPTLQVSRTGHVAAAGDAALFVACDVRSPVAVLLGCWFHPT